MDKTERQEKAFQQVPSEKVGLLGSFYDGVVFGMEYADRNPDPEKLKKVGNLLTKVLVNMYNTKSGRLNIPEFLIEHWNDELVEEE